MTNNEENDYKNTRMIEELDRINQDLKIVSRPRLQEYIFVNVFLPLFHGDEENIYNATMNTWLSVAGSPFNEVDIIDNNGKILFTVPPVYNRNNVHPVDPNIGLPSVASMVATAKQYAQMHPRQGEAYLKSELNKRAMLVENEGQHLVNLNAWNEIFKRYGRTPIMALESEQPSNGSNITPDDIFDPL